MGAVAAAESRSELEPFGVAAGLMWNDRALIVPLCLVLSVSAVVDLVFGVTERSGWLGVVALDRALQISVVTWIVARWRKRLQAVSHAAVSSFSLWARIAVVSVASSILLAMPVLGMSLNPAGASSLLYLVLGALGIVWCLRVYFYFAAVGILGSSVGVGLAQALRISKADGTAALRSLLVPCGVTMLLTACLSLPSPDGRSPVWMAAASAAECAFWILSTYSALGYALTAFSESEWRSAGLTPYRRERLSTLQTQGGKSIPKYLRPRYGMLLCAAALCFMALNLVRQLQQPPAARISVKSVTVADYSVKVELEVEDRTFKFRGFHPVAFSLKTKTGFGISNSLQSVALTADGTGIVPTIVSDDGAPRAVFLTFSSGKTAAALRGLDNVWLWYQMQPLAAITPEMLQ